MNKGSRLVGTAAAIWSRRSLQCTEILAPPVNVALRAQLNLFKATTESAFQQQLCKRSFASGSDEKVNKAIDKATQSKDAHKLLEVVEKHGNEFKESDVVTTFLTIADWDHTTGNHEVLQSKPFQTLVDMVIMGLKRFSNQELSSIIKAAGTLQFDDDMLLDRTSQQLMLTVHKMKAEELYNLATGLAELEHSPSVILFDAISERATEISGDFSPEQKQGLEKAYQKLDYGHEAISKELPDKK